MSKISIITICYNEPNLEKTCESIVNQSCQDFEWVVVDGASNDETQKIWEKYKYRINKFISEPDNGIYNASNKGIKLATSEYLNFMNAGDSFHSADVIEKLLSSDFDNSDVVYGDTNYLPNQNGKIIDYEAPKDTDNNLLICRNINTQAMFIKKELFEKYGYYNEEYKVLADWDRTLCFYKNNAKFLYIPIIVADYDTNGISTTNTERTSIEIEKLRLSYYSEKEIKDTIRFFKIKNRKKYNNIFERIFSIDRNYSKTFDVITILGIKIHRKKHI